MDDGKEPNHSEKIPVSNKKEVDDSELLHNEEQHSIAEQVDVVSDTQTDMDNLVTDQQTLQHTTTHGSSEHSSRASESISEEIIVQNSNNSLNEGVNSFSNHISIPSLHLQSTSQSTSHHTSVSHKSSDKNDASEESSKLDIAYVDENEISHNKVSHMSLKDSLDLASERSAQSRFDDSLENCPNSNIHQNSYISQESNIILGEDSSERDSVMNDSMGDPPLQLNIDTDERTAGEENEDSLSEDVIKLDIRGQATAPKPFQYFRKVFVNYENMASTSTDPRHFDSNIKPSDINLSPSKNIYFYDKLSNKNKTTSNVPVSGVVSESDNKEDDFEQDFAIEEIIMNQSRVMPPPPHEKQEPDCSVSTVTTDYKTLCEDFNTKLTDVQSVVAQKDNIIDELKLSLQEAVSSKDDLQSKYDELLVQVNTLLSERPVEVVAKEQLSDFAKYEQFVNQDGVNAFSENVLYNNNLLYEEKLINVDNPKDYNSIMSSSIKRILEQLNKSIEEENKSIAKLNASIEGANYDLLTLSTVLTSIECDNPDLLNTLVNMETKHKNELEKLRTYFEDRCMKIKKQYSEEIFSQHSKKMSPSSSLDSLDNCPEALPFGSPLHGAGDNNVAPSLHNTISRSHSAEFHLENDKMTLLKRNMYKLEEEHQQQMKDLLAKNEKQIDELKLSYNAHLTEMKDYYENQLVELKAHLQTLQNTETEEGILIEQRKADKDLEEALTLDSKSDTSTWPKEFIAFKERCECEMQQVIDRLKSMHVEELSAIQGESKRQLDAVTDKHKMEIDKWKQKRNDAFDKNRNLEETVKERDALRRMTHTLQKMLSYLVEHFNMCEDELNNTFVGELFKVLEDEDFDNTLFLRSVSANKSYDTEHSTSLNISKDNLEISTVSTKRVHIAPKFSEIMPFIESDCILDCLDKTQDISVHLKQELDTCLMRLHDEAQDLLLLSQASKRKSILGTSNDDQKPTKDHANVEELLQEHQELQDKYEESEKSIKRLEDALEQCSYREASIKAELQTAYEKLSSYHSMQPRSPECYSPLSPPSRLTAELQAAHTEREDLQMQLEAANKQLRSTKQFLEEQAAERESERDEFHRELKQLKEDNNKLIQKNQQYVRITKETEQLESLIREMTNKIHDLEIKDHTKQMELTSLVEEIAVLRDLIANLESQLEVKTSQEVEVMKDLENYRMVAEERESKLKDVSQELAILKNDVASKIADDLLAKNKKKDDNCDFDAEKKVIEQMRGELQDLLKVLSEHTAGLESLHEAICSQSCSSPSEDVSIRDHKKSLNKSGPPLDVSNGRLPVLEVWQLGDGLQRHLKAEDAAVKRIRDLEMQLVQLKDVSQELRMERDVLQERMCEQSLKISSLQSRLDQTRHTVEAQSYHNMEGLRRQLDQALAEMQLLKESLDSKDKQLKAYETTSPQESSKEYIQKLRRDLEEYRNKIREIQKTFDGKQSEFETILADKNADIEVLRQQLLERERHLQAVISLHIDEEKEKEIINEGKLSARTLSDILSISEFDEPDQIMRRTEPTAGSYISGQFNLNDDDLKNNETALPNLHHDVLRQLPVAANSNIEFSHLQNEGDINLHKETSLPNLKEDSYNKDHQHTRSNKELSDNVSLFPNKNASGDKNITIEPKKLNFSMSNVFDQEVDKRSHKNPYSVHNLSLNEPLYASAENYKMAPPYKSLDDLGIVADFQQKVYPDILTQLKTEIQILKDDLNAKTLALKIAQEQLAEFPVLKNDMMELERMLQNSLETMQEDKKYYNSQLERFVSDEKVLKAKLDEALAEVNEKCQETQILKEEILRKEITVSEIQKEKKLVENQLVKVEERCRNLENKSSESQKLKDKIGELEKLEQMISEKNQQIDNLNENLDKLDDLQKQVMEQRNLNDNLNSNLIKKIQEISEIQQEKQKLQHQNDQFSIENKKLTNDLRRISNKNNDLQTTLKVYINMFTLLEKDLEEILQRQMVTPRNAGLSPSNEEIVKFEEYKQLLSGLEGTKSPSSSHSESHLEYQRQDMLNKIRSKVTTLQNELHSKRKELGSKSLQIEKAKLEIEDLKVQVEYFNNSEQEKSNVLKELIAERDELRSNLKTLSSRLREESNMEELQEKIRRKTEECKQLEIQVMNLQAALESSKSFKSKYTEEVENLKALLTEKENYIGQISQTLQQLQQTNVKLASQQQNETTPRSLREKQLAESNLQMELEQSKAACDQLSKQVTWLKSQLEKVQDTRNKDVMNNHNGWIEQDKFDRINAKLEKQMELTESLSNEVKHLSEELEREKDRIVEYQNILDSEKQYFQREMIIKNDQNILVAKLQKKNHELNLELVNAREMLHLQKNKVCELEKQIYKLQETQRKAETVETYETLLELETLLRRNINENIQMSETVRELTQERRDLQAKVRQLENQIKLSNKHSASVLHLPDGVDQQVSFLYGRYMRVDSYRKALIWQKRFLVRIAAAGFIKQTWRDSSTQPVHKFRSVAFAIIAVNRMKYLVKRWHTGNRIGANIHLNKSNVYPSELRSCKSYSHLPTGSQRNEKARHSFTSAFNLSAGTNKLGNRKWTGNSSNPNISTCHNDVWNATEYNVLSEQSILRNPRVSEVVIEENERIEDQRELASDRRNRSSADEGSTSNRFHSTHREPLDAKLHRALFSQTQHDV